MEKWTILTLIILLSLIGSFGNILWKVASNQIGKISWEQLLNIRWDIQTFFTPIVFIALLCFFLGRFASIVPTGYMGITQLAISVTILSLIFTLLLDTAFLKTRYPLTVWIGVLIGLISVYLISYSIKL